MNSSFFANLIKEGGLAERLKSRIGNYFRSNTTIFEGIDTNEYRAPRVIGPQGSLWALKAEPEVVLSEVELQGTSFFGFGSYMNKGQVRSYVEVGRYCSIGRGVSLGLGYHDKEMPSTSSYFEFPISTTTMKLACEEPKRRVIIGHDVWIGDGVRIDSGVTVGTGAILATGAVVNKDVEPYAIVGGLPAKFIKWRFEEDVRNALLESQWWRLEPSELKKYMCTDPLEFVARLKAANVKTYPPSHQSIVSAR